MGTFLLVSDKGLFLLRTYVNVTKRSHIS